MADPDGSTRRQSVRSLTDGGHLTTYKPPLWSVRFWALVFGLWSVPVLIGTIVHYVRALQEGEAASWANSTAFIAPFWYIWALLTPVVLALGRRFPLEGRRIWVSIPTHTVLAVLISLAYLFVTLGVIREIEPQTRSFLESYRYFVAAYLEFEFLLYWAILGTGYLLEYYNRYRAGALRAAQLEAQLAQAHLEALKVQLQPHFLFNTLHAVSSLMDEDVGQARRMLARLGDLLRLTLETQGVQEVTLQQELECMELYLDIERVRFPDKLSVDLIVEPDALEAMVPNLILQPLVENAVRYGIAPRRDGGSITIIARRNAERLRLQVLDDGTGAATPVSERRKGLGLPNVQRRLEELYGEQHAFRTFQREGGGFGVEVVLPYRVAVETAMAIPA